MPAAIPSLIGPIFSSGRKNTVRPSPSTVKSMLVALTNRRPFCQRRSAPVDLAGAALYLVPGHGTTDRRREKVRQGPVPPPAARRPAHRLCRVDCAGAAAPAHPRLSLRAAANYAADGDPPP